MAKITRPRMARGTKLTLQHVNPAITGCANGVETVSPDRMAYQYVDMPLIFHIPAAQGTTFLKLKDPTGMTENAALMIPVVFPPLQDEWLAMGSTNATTPRGIISRMWIAWDQRDEAGAILDSSQVGKGSLDTNDLTIYDMTLRLVSKPTERPTGIVNPWPDVEHARIELTQPGAADNHRRINPAYRDISVDVDPWRTYVLILEAPKALTHCLSGLSIGIDLTWPTVPRDTAPNGTEVQNMPTRHLGSRNTYNIVAAVVAGTIRADGVTGIQSCLETIDAVAVEGFDGGYDAETGESPIYAAIDNDAAYDILQVPLFAGMYATGNNLADLPGVGANPYKGMLLDRQLVHLPYPMVIHRAILVLDFAGPPEDTVGGRPAVSIPSLVTTTYTLGIGMFRGLRADSRTYQQVGLSSITADTLGTRTSPRYLDSIKHLRGGTMTDNPNVDQIMVEVPLVYPIGGASMNSYWTTGKPIWVGRSWTPTSARTQIGNGIGGALVAPVTGGGEQCLEIRLAIQNAVAGLDAENGVAGVDNPVFIGSTGHRLYIIGKRHLTGANAWRG